jgi:DNA replication protein
MSFELKSTDDLVRIAAVGGGFRLDATLRSTDDLVRIANAASAKGSHVVFAGLKLRTTDDLVRIAAAGKGCVFLEG